MKSPLLARTLFASVAAFALAAGIAAAPARAADTGKTAAGPWRIVVLGSSTSAGAGAHPNSMGWVSRYEMYMKTLNPGNEVINRAVGGYQTYNLMPTGFVPPQGRRAPVEDRNITYALAQNPDAIIINLPSNDVGAGNSLEEQQQNFRVIADLADKAGVPLWVTTVQPRNFGPDKMPLQLAMRDWLRTTFGDRCIDFWTGLEDEKGHIRANFDSKDGVHLNNAGHAFLFQRVAAANIPGRLARMSASR